jgi:D-alanine-D-alanine ligase
MAKLKVGILFGGRSAEHEVSLQSAANIYHAIDREKFEPVLVGIDKQGRWLFEQSHDFLLNAGDPKRIALNPAGTSIALLPEPGGKLADMELQKAKDRPLPALDVVFPILHGPYGEDGTVQGLLKLAGVPFVGPSVLGSAVGMDKDVMKRLLRDAGIPIGKFRVLRQGEVIPPYEEVAAELGSIMFVKPANMGSSVGVNKIHGKSEYEPFIREAFKYDNKVILEEFIHGREIECAVLGNEDVIASQPGEILPHQEFYSYDAKYIDPDGAGLDVPAKLPRETAEQVRSLAIKTFKTLCCEGLSRVDCFLREDGRIFVNEINTIPGFTKISMYPKLWEAAGLAYPALIDRLISLALRRHEAARGLRTSYTAR